MLRNQPFNSVCHGTVCKANLMFNMSVFFLNAILERTLRRRQSIRIVVRIMLLGALVVVSPACDDLPQAAEAEDPLAVNPVPVRASQAKITTLYPSVDLVGVLTAIPEQTAMLAAKISGQIEHVGVVEGQQVHIGDEIARLDSRVAKARLDRAQADVDQATATLERLQRGARVQEIEAARQGARHAEAVANELLSKFQGLKMLYDQHELSDRAYKQAESKLKAAEAESAAAAAKLDLLKAGTRPENIAVAKAQLAAARADLSAASLAVAFCNVTSPINGTVIQLLAKQGMSATPSTEFATIVNLSELFVQIRVPGAYLVKVRIGARAVVNVNSIHSKQFEGIVQRISGQADPEVGDINAFVRVSNENGLLRPGLGCRVRVYLPDIPDALVIPVEAVADRDGTPVVTVLRQNKAYELPIQLGVTADDQVQVIEGLEEGDRIATEGGYGLPKGCPVRIIADGAGK